MALSASSASLGLQQTRRRIARWRETRTHRGAPMPATLWAAAVALARQHGLYTTTRTLRLDYGWSCPGLMDTWVKLPPVVLRAGARRPAD